MNQKRSKPRHKRNNALVAALFFWQIIYLIVLLIIKTSIHTPFRLCILDLITLGVTIGYVGIGFAVSGLLLSQSFGNAHIQKRDKIIETGHKIFIDLLLFGNVVVCFFYPENLYYFIFSLVAWLIIFILVSVVKVKTGAVIIDKEEVKEEKISVLRVIPGALIFGIIMNRDELLSEGAFHPSGIPHVLLLALFWGFFYYLGMREWETITKKDTD